MVIVETFEEDVSFRVFFSQRFDHFGQRLFDEYRTGTGSLSSAYDEETASGTCESYVEQIEVVYRVLKMLLLIVVFIDSTLHLLLAVIDGHDG